MYHIGRREDILPFCTASAFVVVVVVRVVEDGDTDLLVEV